MMPKYVIHPKFLKRKKFNAGLIMEYFTVIVLSILLIISAIIDLRTQKIPNLIVYPSMVVALAYNTITNGFGGLLFSGGGILIGTLLLIVPYLMGGMGAGDAKLMGAIGGFLGAKGVLFAFFFTAFVGGIYAVILVFVNREAFSGFFKKQLNALINFILLRKYMPDNIKSTKNRPKLCYGLPIALGTGILIFLETIGYNFFVQ
jgi:prepilin peptidase CpaA